MGEPAKVDYSAAGPVSREAVMRGPAPYTRQLSYNERIFLAFDEICPPCCNQFIFEGSGVLDHARWLSAVEIASEANPGSRMTLQGHLAFSRWVDSGITPRVSEVGGNTWDGYGPEGAPFLTEKLHYREGPTCEVVLVQGVKPRVIFRTHHGVMDGRGTMVWAEDVFRALRGESPLGAFSTVNDCELVKSFRKGQHDGFPSHHLAPAGRASGEGSGVVWKRVRIQGRFRNVLSRCAVLAAREAWRHADGPVRFGIPVDMRQRLNGQRSTANLSIAIYVEVRPETTPEQIAGNITSQLREGREGMTFRGDGLISHVPLWLIATRARKIIRTMHRRSRYSLSGIISNVGRVDLSMFAGGGFVADDFWALPPRNEYHPFFLGLFGYGDTLGMTLAMPRVLGDKGRLDSIMESLVRGLKE